MHLFSSDVDVNKLPDDDPHSILVVETVASDDEGDSGSESEWENDERFNDEDSEDDELTPVETNAIDVDLHIPTSSADAQGEKPNYSEENSKKVNLDLEGDRAQLDAGTFTSCTGDESLLHGHAEFSESDPCPIKLKLATEGSDALPVGCGFLHTPAHDSRGHLAVRTFYTPALQTTVIDERDFCKAAGFSLKEMKGDCLRKDFDTGICTYHAEHRLKRSNDVMVHGVVIDGKCHTDALIPPPPNNPAAEFVHDEDFEVDCQRATVMAIHACQEEMCAELRERMKDLPRMFHELPFHECVHENTPVNKMRAETERLLWHQRLGHPSDYCLHNAHKHVEGVPRFKHEDKIFDICPTCIRAKQTKEPAGKNSTRRAILSQSHPWSNVVND